MTVLKEYNKINTTNDILSVNKQVNYLTSNVHLSIQSYFKEYLPDCTCVNIGINPYCDSPPNLHRVHEMATVSTYFDLPT